VTNWCAWRWDIVVTDADGAGGVEPLAGIRTDSWRDLFESGENVRRTVEPLMGATDGGFESRWTGLR